MAPNTMNNNAAAADSLPLDQATMMKHMQSLNDNAVVVNGEHGVERTFDDSNLVARNTLLFTKCRGSTFHVNAYCTKVLVEDCADCTFHFNSKVITSVCELWRTAGCTFNMNTAMKTVQMDGCSGLSAVNFMKKEDFDRLIWAGVERLQVTFGDSNQRLDTSFAALKQAVPDLHEGTDQHIVRFVAARLLQELVVRLPNGFPTTEREAKEFDRQQEAMAKAMAREMGVTVSRAKPEGPRVGRNDSWACGSGKKAKKCCQA